MCQQSKSLPKLRELIKNSVNGVVFTGAGISTDSGIPDFRSPGGVWAKREPVLYSDFLNSQASRYEYWSQKAESHSQMYPAQPNVAHREIARWEALGKIRGVITQNIDGLHQLAGSQSVLELHGTARYVSCISCGYREDADPLVRQFLELDAVPDCPDCGGLMKHATVSFGQQLPEDILSQAAEWSAECDLFVVFGSSLVVHPAAGLPQLAKRNGADLVIVNRDTTPLDSIASLVIHESIAETLTAVSDAIGS